MLIHIVDQDKKLLEFLKNKLQEEQFEVSTSENALDSIRYLKSKPADLAIIELDFEILDGKTLLIELNQIKPNLPVIILTKKDSTETIVNSFRLGADDYITKPFDYKELLARIKARTGIQKNENKLLKFQDLVLDKQKKTITQNTKRLRLSHKEYALLSFLMQNKSQVFSREMLLERVWGMDKFVVTRSVDVYIARLRKKLGNKNKYIQTRRGFGYTMKE